MINSTFFKENNIPISWKTIIVGRKLGLVDNKFIDEYATNYLLEHYKIDNPYILELASNLNDDFEINNNLEKLTQNFNITTEEIADKSSIEHRKWRYILLKNLTMKNYSNMQLLRKLEEVYCDFEHPEDMISFIPYMPYPEDTYDFKNHTPDENREHLIQLFYQFLEKEKQELQK